MSNTLVCLSEPVVFHALEMKKSELGYSESSNVGCKSVNSEDTSEMQICSSDQKENNYSKESSIKNQTVSRKREATNVLVDCVKRRDNSRNSDFELNVPSQKSSHDSSLHNSKFCSVPPRVFEENIKSLCSADTLCIAYLSDSTSTTDSGIDTSSKSSSPCHSIDALSSQDDGIEECHSVMDVDNFESVLSQDVLKSSNTSTSGQSPVPIYEDLHCLHLTDETAPLQDDTTPKSPISKSLFKNVASSIYFASKDEKMAPMPENVLPFMKWKLSTITPVVIKEIVQKSGFILLDANTPEEWLGTWGKHLKCSTFKRIKNYQKVNHYPGSFHLGRKDKLWENYKRMQSRHGTDVYNFFPETFHLPNDLNLLKAAWEGDVEKCWIIKPPASARGTGVKVICKWSQIPQNKPVIVQRYLSNPYLINGTKFDLRIYVLVSSIEPLKIYVFEDGLVRFASEKYSLSNKSFSNRFVHLTNYSINKKSSSYTANEDENLCQGHKWTLKTFWSYMTNSGIDIEKIQESITDMLIKTIICAEGPICRLMKTYAKSTYNCYELFGFDIMLDKNLRPWLLEVNISPSLHIRSMLDAKIKGQMVKDMLNMVGFQVPEKRSTYFNANPPDYGVLSTVANKHKALRNRSLSQAEKNKHSLYTFHYEKSDILANLTPDDARCLIESEDEFHRKGAFTRIFPTPTSSKYFVYFEHNRYYNLLLDAWEKSYCSRRNEGISLLQDLCEKKVHLQTVLREHSRSVTEPEIEITVH